MGLTPKDNNISTDHTQWMTVPIWRFLSRNPNPIHCFQIQEMQWVEAKWAHLIIPSSVNDNELLVSHHAGVSSCNRRLAIDFGFYDVDGWLSKSDNKHFTIQLSTSSFASKKIDSFFCYIWVKFNNIFRVIDTIYFSLMK